MPLKLGTTEFNTPLSKVYRGAELIWEEEPSEIEFSSCPFPTSWEVVADSNNNKYTATNEYGVWNIESSSYLYSYSHVNKAFDGNTNTYWESTQLSNNNVFSTIMISCPIKIQPSKIYAVYSHNSSAGKSTIYGYNPDTDSWEQLGNITNSSATYQNVTLSITINNFYTKFKIDCYRYSSSYTSPKIREFQIISGILKK